MWLKPTLTIIILNILLFGIFQNCNRFEKNQTLDISSKENPDNLIEDYANIVQESDIWTTNHPPTQKNVEENFSFQLQLADKNYIKAIILEIFGPDSNSKVNEIVTNNPNYFGGPCSEYESYKGSGKTCSETQTKIDLVAPPQSARQGYMIQLCTDLIDKNNKTLLYIMNKIKSGSTTTTPPEININNLIILHKMFYRNKPLPNNDFFNNIILEMNQSTSNLIGWKLSIYSYCISSQWQVI